MMFAHNSGIRRLGLPIQLRMNVKPAAHPCVAALLLIATIKAYGAALVTPTGSRLSPITNEDDEAARVPITDVFPLGVKFGDEIYNHIFVSSNGYVTFGQKYDDYHPVGISVWDGPPIIAVMYDDLDPSQGGKVLYNQDASRGRVVVTYRSVAPYDTPPYFGAESDRVSLQIILTRPESYAQDNRSFVATIRYANIGWHRSDNISSFATAGWSIDGESEEFKGSETPYSGTSEFHRHTQASNIGESGVFQWRVEHGTVQTTAPDLLPSEVEPTQQNRLRAVLRAKYRAASSAGSVERRGFEYASTPGFEEATFVAATQRQEDGTYHATIDGFDAAEQRAVVWVRAVVKVDGGTRASSPARIRLINP